MKPGDHRNIDFEVPSADGHPVNGIVSGLPAEWPENKVSVFLTARNSDLGNLETVAVDDAGRFRFDSVPPGDYYTELGEGAIHPAGLADPL